MVAGGLTVSNVAELVREVRPWCVDVASGVEDQYCNKLHSSIKQFIRNAKHALNATA